MLSEFSVDEPFWVVPYRVPDTLSSSAGPRGAGSSKRSCVASAPTSVGYVVLPVASWHKELRRRRNRLRNERGCEGSFSEEDVSEPLWRFRCHRLKTPKQTSATTTATPTTIPAVAPVDRPLLFGVPEAGGASGAVNVLSEGRIIETMLVFPIGSAMCTA